MQQQQNAAAAAVDKNKLGKNVFLSSWSPSSGRGLEKHKNDEAATRIM